jgi:glycerol kinase
MMKIGLSYGNRKPVQREPNKQPDSRKADVVRTIELLTLRERGVLKRIVGGFSNKEIAAEFGVSANTISVHVRNIYKKIRVHSRKEAVSAMALVSVARDAEKDAAGQVRLTGFPRRGGGALRQYVLALDQGTTRSCAIVFDKKGNPVSFAQKKVEPTYSHPDWVENDGLAIWSSQAGVAVEAIASAGLHESQIAAIGIASQRATTVVWDRETGRPVCPAIMWQDRRTADMCDRLKKDGYAEWIRAKTGLVPDPYFSATKIKWILDHVKGARRLAEEGRLLFGTVDTWLAWNCTQGEVHVTDASNASHTLLYNIHTGEWDRELLALFSIPEKILPQIRSSSEVYGVTQAPFVAAGVPIAAVVGDQQAAMFAQRCNVPGMVKCTYGAGCFMVMNTGSKLIKSKNNLLTTVAWHLGNKVTYALEGNIYVAGAVVDWLRDGLGIIRKTSDVKELAMTVPDNGGVYMVPAFDGLGAPHWKSDARGTLVGLTRDTTAGHIARAALEGIAYQTRDALKAMEADAGIPISELRVDGDGTSNRLLMQFQSDILGVPVSCPKALETRALGAAYLAGLAVGFWSGQNEIDLQWKEDRRFLPAMKSDGVRRLVKEWDRALKTAAFWGT